MNIGIDIDDTLTNTKELQTIYWKEYITNHPNNDYTEELPTNINQFGIPYIQAFWDTYREELSFIPSFKENASKCLKMLKEAGFNIYIVTSRQKHRYNDLENRIIKQFKENNIYFDYIITDSLDKGKTLKDNNIDILIDDSIEHIESAYKYNKIGIHFSNNSPYKYHTNNWLELYNILINIKNME